MLLLRTVAALGCMILVGLGAWRAVTSGDISAGKPSWFMAETGQFTGSSCTWPFPMAGPPGNRDP
jgi:hypothetical protein